MLASRLFHFLGTASAVFAASWIVPGAVWKDTAGNTIDAHGGMIYQRGTTFYWIGQSASNSMSYEFQAVGSLHFNDFEVLRRTYMNLRTCSTGLHTVHRRLYNGYGGQR